MQRSVFVDNSKPRLCSKINFRGNLSGSKPCQFGCPALKVTIIYLLYYTTKLQTRTRTVSRRPVVFLSCRKRNAGRLRHMDTARAHHCDFFVFTDAKSTALIVEKWQQKDKISNCFNALLPWKQVPKGKKSSLHRG